MPRGLVKCRFRGGSCHFPKKTELQKGERVVSHETAAARKEIIVEKKQGRDNPPPLPLHPLNPTHQLRPRGHDPSRRITVLTNLEREARL